MNPINKILVAGVLPLLALLTGQRAFAFDGFLRPSGWYVDYNNPDYKSKTGAAVAVGATLGVTQAHELAVEVAQVSWAVQRPFGLIVPGGFLGVTGSGRLTPVLANYRCYLGRPEARVRFYGGGSLGEAKVAGDIAFLQSGFSYGGHTDTWRTMFGGTAGVAISLTPAVRLDVGYRYLQWSDSAVATRFFVGAGGFTGAAASTLHFGETKANIAALGLTLRF